LSKFDAIIFDFDGTLFQTEKLVLYAFDKTFSQLEADGYVIERFPTEADILSVIGMTLDKIWAKLLPNLPEDAHIKANELLLTNELEGVKSGYGALYPKVVETLLQLKNGNYRLFIASNGLEDYIKGLAKAFRIDHYFEAMYSAGEFNTASKDDLVARLIKNYSISNGVMVGDRISDISAGKYNGLYTIACDFGFASQEELKDADSKIDSFDQLVNVLSELQE